MTPFKNILVIQTAFIGDAILASSLLEKLHKYFPDATLSILVRKGNEGIYEAHPFLKETLVWNKKEKKIKNLFGLLSIIRKNKFDAVINCHRYGSSGFLTAFSGARHTAGYKENPFSFMFNFTSKHIIGDGRHEVERYNQLIEDFTDKTLSNPKLYPSIKDEEKIKSLMNGSYVCMAPASVWYTKQLPLEKWIKLCDKIPSENTIYLLGAKGDIHLCNEIKSRSKHLKIEILAGTLTLLQSCVLMKGALMNYVNDSGPLHMASSVNAPVTAFFCSTVPEFGFGPLSDNKTVIQVEDLKCRPCGLHGHKACPEGHFKCGNLIPLENSWS
ncbi:glycosyltransferase family 9 protein [Aurantibacillus circumpalustris]|uniref:glycosyltransferase family 9 protein n=1 Tax=Aurantibacillus circumpalustris TaxID=3036359 RepID=UPI00295BCD0F|nr:glycosyltransferase family 9 protein [Aurantibacillus circumpalustris]